MFWEDRTKPSPSLLWPSSAEFIVRWKLRGLVIWLNFVDLSTPCRTLINTWPDRGCHTYCWIWWVEAERHNGAQIESSSERGSRGPAGSQVEGFINKTISIDTPCTTDHMLKAGDGNGSEYLRRKRIRKNSDVYILCLIGIWSGQMADSEFHSYCPWHS